LVVVDELGTRLMVYLSEDDRLAHRGLHEALLERAREDGMAGATVWRAIEGFGASGRLRTTRFPDMTTGLPLAFELIDTAERVDAFATLVKRLAPGSLVTMERVRMARREATGTASLDDPTVKKSERPKTST
jgi:uncharacterized protein